MQNEFDYYHPHTHPHHHFNKSSIILTNQTGKSNIENLKKKHWQGYTNEWSGVSACGLFFVDYYGRKSTTKQKSTSSICHLWCALQELFFVVFLYGIRFFLPSFLFPLESQLITNLNLNNNNNNNKDNRTLKSVCVWLLHNTHIQTLVKWKIAKKERKKIC